MDLREAIARKLKVENGVDFAPAQVVVSGGAKQSLSNIILSSINPGDEVIIPVPAWVSYIEMVKLAEGVNVLVPAGIENDFKITPQQLEDAITPRTRMVLFCSPSNPREVFIHARSSRALLKCLHAIRRSQCFPMRFTSTSTTQVSSLPWLRSLKSHRVR